MVGVITAPFLPMVGVITAPFQNEFGRAPAKKPGRAFRCNLFAPPLATQKGFSLSIPHAHCGALKILYAIARILRAISTFASGKHSKMPEAF
jgi:hypothetical protein